MWMLIFSLALRCRRRRRCRCRRAEQAVHGAERVAVVDIDVHHGNGTQALFRADPTTFYASTHQVLAHTQH